MACDLILGQTPRDWSRGEAEPREGKFHAWLNVTALAGAGYLAYATWFKGGRPEPGRRVPEPASRRTARTVKVPYQSMKETVFGR